MKILNYFLLSSLLLFQASCVKRGYETYEGYAQGGRYCVKSNMEGVRESRERVAFVIDSLLTAIDTTFSGYNNASELSRLNNGESVSPSPMMRDLIGISEEYGQMTGGAFDIYAAPLFDIWGFGFKNDSLPSDDRVREVKMLCNEKKVMNFNAIAQGYTCDLIAGYLYSIGVKDMLVDVGEIYCDGVNASGKGWCIGIDTPTDGNNCPGAHLSGIWQSDGKAHGVVTSGNYRKFYIRDGKKYAHTIDPRTGYPVSHNLLSATVTASTATESDAMATYFMVIGFEEAKKFILSSDNLEACLITTDTTWFSPGFLVQ